MTFCAVGARVDGFPAFVYSIVFDVIHVRTPGINKYVYILYFMFVLLLM